MILEVNQLINSSLFSSMKIKMHTLIWGGGGCTFLVELITGVTLGKIADGFNINSISLLPGEGHQIQTLD